MEAHESDLRRPLSRLQQHAVRTGSHFVVALAFAIPLSTSVVDALVLLIAICWLVGGQFAATLAVIRDNRIVQVALLLFGVYAVGVTYSTAPLDEALGMLGKYRKLLMIPVLIPFLSRRSIRRSAIRSFQAAMIVTLAASTLMWFGVLESKYAYGFEDNCAFFKNHITQNILMAFLIFTLAHDLNLRIPATDILAYPRRLWINGTAGRLCVVGLIAACTYNLLFMVHGRSGYVVLAALACLFLYQHFGSRGLIASTVSVCVLAIVGYSVSNRLQQRVDLAIQQARSFSERGTAGEESSIGRRLTFYRASLQVLTESPLIGAGTGSFETELARIEGPQNVASKNPHSEYFHAGVQAGAIGIAMYVLFLVLQWRSCSRVPGDTANIAAGIVVLMAVGSVMNSLLLDTTEGHMFCLLTAASFGQIRKIHEQQSGQDDTANHPAMQQTTAA
ncbi:MAG: O-antigen ligase family protein [Planctomycetota bacterium]|nr:O-antigen ligase family protein [Planctomycetota bacterium]